MMCVSAWRRIHAHGNMHRRMVLAVLIIGICEALCIPSTGVYAQTMSPINTTVIGTLPSPGNPITDLMYRLDGSGTDASILVAIAVQPAALAGGVRLIARFGSYPTLDEYDAEAYGVVATVPGTHSGVSLALKPSCQISSLDSKTPLFVRLLSSNPIDDVQMSAFEQSSTLLMTQMGATDTNTVNTTTTVIGEIPCCGSSRRYDVNLVRPTGREADVALLRLRLQNPTASNAPTLKLMAKRSGCASTTHFDAAVDVLPGSFGELLLEDELAKGRWYVTVTAADNVQTRKAYTLTAELTSVSSSGRAGLYTDASAFTSLMAFRHRNDGEGTDAKLLGTSAWLWIAIFAIAGIILGGVIGIASWSALKEHKSRKESEYVALQLPSTPQRMKGGGASTSSPLPEKSGTGIGSSGSQPASKAKARVTFSDDGDDASPSSVRRLDTELMSDIEEGNHDAIERSITIIDKYHKTRSMSYSHNDDDGGDNDRTAIDMELGATDGGPVDLVYAAEISGPSGQLPLVHGKNNVGRGVAGCTCKKVSRQQLVLTFHAETGIVHMQVTGKNPSALRRSGSDNNAGNDERGGWKVLTSDDAAVRLRDSDEFALCLPSRVPTEDVTFALVVNKL